MKYGKIFAENLLKGPKTKNIKHANTLHYTNLNSFETSGSYKSVYFFIFYYWLLSFLVL